MADWKGKGKGRKAGQASISTKSDWKGAGKGRKGGNAKVGTGSQLGTRSSNSTTQMTKGGKGLAHVADPEGNFIFALEIDGIEIAQFLECSGLKSNTEVFELQEGGMNHRVHKLPGQSRWDNIQLRYGVTNDASLITWRDEILQDDFGGKSRRNGSIVIKNNSMEVVRRYNFLQAWPVTWEGPSLSASGSELAIEMMELAHHGISVS
jgi:phage tail-like protein